MARRGAAAVAVAILLGGCSSGTPGPPPAADPRSGAPAGSAAVLPPEAAVRAAHTMTPLPSGRLLVAGGCVVDGCTTATTSAYVLDAAGARQVDGLAEARDAHTATALPDGRVLVTGGFTGEGVPPLSSAELFDPATGGWEQVGSLALGRGGHAAALLGDGRVVVAGGWISSGTYTATTEIFDPASGEFTAGPDLPAAVDGLAATSLPDGSVLIAGGQLRPGVASDVAVRIAPDGTMAPVGSLSTGRFKHALLTLDSGRAVVLGGTSDDEELLRSTEVYDPATHEFHAGPDLCRARYKLAGSAAVLPGDRIAVAGGGPGVELLDVGAGVCRPVSGLGEEWGSFSTLGIAGGNLVLVGGYDRGIQLTGAARSVPVDSLSD